MSNVRALSLGPLETRIENLHLPEIHPVANNMKEHREKLN